MKLTKFTAIKLLIGIWMTRIEIKTKEHNNFDFLTMKNNGRLNDSDIKLICF